MPLKPRDWAAESPSALTEAGGVEKLSGEELKVAENILFASAQLDLTLAALCRLHPVSTDKRSQTPVIEAGQALGRTPAYGPQLPSAPLCPTRGVALLLRTPLTPGVRAMERECPLIKKPSSP